ncbi:MAG TPA: hypothetical protein VME92_05455 [Acetobacteraceae bacterium]|nr:hypothetical protein [Acetobacteraceae bacterium]
MLNHDRKNVRLAGDDSPGRQPLGVAVGAERAICDLADQAGFLEGLALCASTAEAGLVQSRGRPFLAPEAR